MNDVDYPSVYLSFLNFFRFFWNEVQKQLFMMYFYLIILKEFIVKLW